MNRLTNRELIEITGGAASFLTASFLNAVSKCMETLLEVGRSIGTAIRRISSKNMCS